MNNRPTFQEQFDDQKRIATRETLKRLANVMVLVLVVFCGFLNYSLYSRPFEGWAKLIGLVPAVGISGSLLLFMRANISWFSVGAQEKFGRVFSWALFALEGMNAVTEWNIINGALDSQSGIIRMWANLGIPVAALIVLGMWKLIIDGDDDAEVTREANLGDAIVRRELREYTLQALDSSENRNRRREAARVKAQRQTDWHTGQFVVDAETTQPAAPVLQMAKDEATNGPKA